MKRLAILLLGALCPACGSRASAEEFEKPEIRGEECSTFVSVEAATGSGVTVSFPQAPFTLTEGRRVVRCLVSVPVVVPPGFQAGWPEVRWEGRATVPQNSYASVALRVFFAGQSPASSGGRAFTEEGEWHLSLGASEAWTPCGQKVDLGILVTLVQRGEGFLFPQEVRVPHLVYKRCT